MLRPVAARVLVAAMLLGAGCGTSGSNPPVLPEVYFQIAPRSGGSTQFTVQSITSSGVSHPSLANAQFTISSNFYIALDNATPPYCGTFVAAAPAGGAAADITVTLAVAPAVGAPVAEQSVQAHTDVAGGVTMATVEILPLGATPGMITPGGSCPTLPPANPEVRFDVCSPLPNAVPPPPFQGCLGTSGQPGIAGVEFSGSVGDAVLSHTIGGFPNPNVPAQSPLTPSIYLFDDPQDTASGVFRSASAQLLAVQLFVNGELDQTQSGTGDVTVKHDL